MIGLLSAPATATQITHMRRLWLYALLTLAIAFLLAPSLIVMPMSFTSSTFLEFPPQEWSTRWYRNYFGTAEWREATWMSVKVALLTVLMATPLGTMAAYGLHASRLRSAPLLMGFLILPMLVPHILMAIGVFFTYASIGLLNTTLGLVLAHTTLSIPFVVVVVTAGLRSFDISLEMAARSLGASRLQAFFSATLPQIRFSIIWAVLFTFITSFDEVIIAFFTATGSTSTLPRKMFLALRDAIDPTIAAISTLLIVLTIVLLILAQTFGTEARSRR